MKEFTLERGGRTGRRVSGKGVKEARSTMTDKPKKQNHQVPETKTPQQQKPPPQLRVAATPPVPATSQDALNAHLAEWGGSGGRLFAFNGQTGIHRTLDDDVEVPDGTEFVALLGETQKGFIKFNDGGPPDVCMVRIDQLAKSIKRDDLGDNDKSQWPDWDGEPKDPWIEQFVIPMTRNDAGGELYALVARGVVAMNSVANLLGRWRFHPKRLQGLNPVIRIKNSTYWSKRFAGYRPKPEYAMVDWVLKDGMPSSPAPSLVPPSSPPSLAQELNDEIPDFSKK
jgi:hypothetical protein